VTGLLEEAFKTPTVKRVVITSSISAITSFKEMTTEPTGELYTHQSRVINPSFSNAWDAYFAAKAAGLNAADAFMESRKPSFDLIHLMVGSVIGPQEVAKSVAEVAIPMNIVPLGVVLGQPGVGPLGMTAVYIDDVADIHIHSLDPKIEGNRGYILIADGTCSLSWSEANKYAQELFPEAVKDGRFPLNGGQQDFTLRYETSDTEKMFGIKFKSYKEQVESLFSQYLDLLAKAPEPDSTGIRLLV
jgi:nucleoside-diphosphate-sugar epimerase